MSNQAINFANAQAAWDNAHPPEGGELPGDYLCCEWCGEPTGSEWKEWDGVKRPATDEEGPEGVCLDCYEKYACSQCLTMDLHLDPINGLCPKCLGA